MRKCHQLSVRRHRFLCTAKQPTGQIRCNQHHSKPHRIPKRVMHLPRREEIRSAGEVNKKDKSVMVRRCAAYEDQNYRGMSSPFKFYTIPHLDIQHRDTSKPVQNYVHLLPPPLPMFPTGFQHCRAGHISMRNHAISACRHPCRQGSGGSRHLPTTGTYNIITTKEKGSRRVSLHHQTGQKGGEFMIGVSPQTWRGPSVTR